MTRPVLPLQWKFLLSVALIIFPTIGAVFIWATVRHEKQAMEQVLNQARVLTGQIILTRKWVSDVGGIMVRMNEGKKGEGTYFHDERLETENGVFQKFTPSMVTKTLSQYALSQDRYGFRIVGLDPLNPENAADQFEKDALRRFERDGIREDFRTSYGEKNQFQYIVPLFVDMTCLSCHNANGLQEGDVGGGLSVLFPIDETKLMLKKDRWRLLMAGVGMIMLIIFTIFILLRRVVISPLKKLEEMSTDIGRGNLEARANISTGDELERLGGALNAMAERLRRGRDSLEEKIRQSTDELSRANRELKTVDKLKSDFLANMSHELRSPLTVIRGGVDYLNRTIKGAENRNYLSIIDKNLTRLIHLVSELFDFTRIENQKVEWSFEKENVSWLVKESVEILTPMASDKDISITYHYPGDIFAPMDLERIEQVLINLIENAIKFSDPGTALELNVAEEHGRVHVSVRDQGKGIPEGNLEIIFEKFQTLSSPGTRGEPKGAGLGLAICRKIVEVHGGRIWAEQAGGGGSIFHFTLPKEGGSKD